jgi:tetratricopeptide (TPR) repeat protein
MKLISHKLKNSSLLSFAVLSLGLSLLPALPAFSQTSTELDQVSTITRRAQSNASALLFVANLAEAKGDYKKAIESYNKLSGIYKSDPGIGPNSAKCAWLVSKVAICYNKLERKEEAAKKCRESLAILSADTYDGNPADEGFAVMARENCSPILGKEMPAAAAAKPAQAKLHIIPACDFADIAESEKQVKDQLSVLQKKEPSGFRTLKGQLYLADIYTLEKKYAEAEPLFKKTISGLQKKFGKGDQQLLEPLSNYGYMLQAAGKQKEADDVLKHMQEIISAKKTVIVNKGTGH